MLCRPVVPLSCQSLGKSQGEEGNVKLGGLSHGLVGDFVRIMLAVNVQVISDILDSQKQWAIYFTKDGSTC